MARASRNVGRDSGPETPAADSTVFAVSQEESRPDDEAMGEAAPSGGQWPPFTYWVRVFALLALVVAELVAAARSS